MLELIKDFESRAMGVYSVGFGPDCVYNTTDATFCIPKSLARDTFTFDEIAVTSDPDDIVDKFTTALDRYVNCRGHMNKMYIVWRVTPEFTNFFDDSDGTIKSAAYCRLALLDKAYRKVEGSV